MRWIISARHHHRLTAAKILTLTAMAACLLGISSSRESVIAQAMTLTVSADRGIIKTGDACPSPRDSGLYLTIQAGVACALAGDVVNIRSGIYYETLTLDKSIRLLGVGATSVVLDASQAPMPARVLTITNAADVIISGVKIQGGQAELGGGVHITAANVALTDLMIVQNQAERAGGGVYLASGNLVINNAVIMSNRVAGVNLTTMNTLPPPLDVAGGGIYVESGSVLIRDSRITQNGVTLAGCGSALGGGLFNRAGTVQLSLSLISQNRLVTSSCVGNLRAEGAGVYGLSGIVAVSTDTRVEDEMFSAVSGGVVAQTIPDLTDVIAVRLGQAPRNRLESPEATSETVILPEATQEVTGFAQNLAPVIPTAIPHNTTFGSPMIVATSISPQSEESQVAVAWMTTLNELVRDEYLSPLAASRLFAYAGVALYEAVLPSMPSNRSLSGQLNGLLPLPQPQPDLVYQWDLVANHALATVLENLMPTMSEAARRKIITQRERINQQAAAVLVSGVVTNSRQYGETLGQALLSWAAHDNYATTRAMSYSVPSGDAQFWKPLEGQRPLEPYWGMLRPFGLPLANMCEVPLDVPFSTDPVSAFYAEAREVYNVTQDLSPDQVAIAEHWSDDPGMTYTPPGHWVSIQIQLVTQLQLPIGRAAEMFALTNLAMADSFISCWSTKYRYQLVRPITYIRDYIDPLWQPLLSTPPFPEYPSGHSVSSGAAASVLTYLFGDVAFTDSTHMSRGLAPREYASFHAAAAEAAISRLYGGIHFRSGIEHGVKQGRCVAEQVLQRVRLRG